MRNGIKRNWPEQYAELNRERLAKKGIKPEICPRCGRAIYLLKPQRQDFILEDLRLRIPPAYVEADGYFHSAKPGPCRIIPASLQLRDTA